jgi:hypothetical protein
MAPGAARALLVAGIRESFEEVGVLVADAVDGSPLDTPERRARLAAARTRMHGGELRLVDLAREEGLRLRIDRVRLFAHWITPEGEAQRFDTYFLVTRHPEGQRPLHDAHETIDSEWVVPAEGLDRHRRNEFVLPPPTFRTLEMLSGYADAESVLEAARTLPIPPVQPRIRSHDGNLTLLLPGDPLYPAEQGIEGPTRIVLRDGAWRSESAPA